MKIAIIDSGANEYCLNRINVIQYESFVNNKEDKSLHGTACALLINKLVKAEYYILKILDGEGAGTSKCLVQALEHMLYVDVDIINMSISTNSSTCEDELYKLCAELSLQNKVIVAAQMNRQTTATYPAFFDCVIGVKGGSYYDSKRFILREEQAIQYTFDSTPVFVKVDNSIYKLFKGNSKACALATAHLSCSNTLAFQEDKYHSAKENRITFTIENIEQIVSELFGDCRNNRIFGRHNKLSIAKCVDILHKIENSYSISIDYETISFKDILKISSLHHAINNTWAFSRCQEVKSIFV